METTEQVDDEAIAATELIRQKELNKELKKVISWHSSKRSINEKIVRAWRTLEKHTRRLFGHQSSEVQPLPGGGSVWQDPYTGDRYRRFPITLTKYTQGAEVFDIARYERSGRTPVELFAYDLPTGIELQFIPNFSMHYFSGKLVRLNDKGDEVVPVTGGYACRLEATDHDGAVHRGVIWSGTTGDINNSLLARDNGTPIVYNGDAIIHLVGGDRLRLIAWIPKDAESVKFHPLFNPELSHLAFHCYNLYPIRGPDVFPPLSSAKSRKKKSTKKSVSKKNRRKKHAR